MPGPIARQHGGLGILDQLRGAQQPEGRERRRRRTMGTVGSTRTRAERYLISNSMQKKPHDTLLSM